MGPDERHHYHDQAHPGQLVFWQQGGALIMVGGIVTLAILVGTAITDAIRARRKRNAIRIPESPAGASPL